MPNVKLTVRNEEIKGESEFVECGKEDIKNVVVNYVEENTGKVLAPQDVYQGYTVSMVQAYPIAPKDIPGYTVVKEPRIDWNNDFVENGREYTYEYRRDGDTPPEPDEPIKFDDVKASDWYYSAVNYVSQKKLMTGLKENIFGPNDTLARAQFAVILYRMNESPTVEYTAKFPDVEAGVWYTDAILWASGTKVVTGYSDSGRFGPSDSITREQIATMMYRYALYKEYDVSEKTDFTRFIDSDKVNTFAKEAMQWAVGTGIISGKENGTMLDPQGNATRAECAAIMMRFLEKYQ